MEEFSRLSPRFHRRTSVSLPSGLNLLIQIAEHTWQSSPKADSDFDELQDNTDLNNSRYGRNNGQDQYLLSGDRSETETEQDEVSDYSEMDQCPSPAPFPRRNSRTRTQHIPLQVKNVVNDPEDDEIMAEIRPKPLSSRRKSATIPPLKLQSSTYDAPDGSPSSTPTTPTSSPSASSFSGLIKGKWNSMAIPQVFKTNKNKGYKLQVFVAILFLAIILLVGSIYVIHKEKELHKAYFEQIRFSGKERKIRAVNMKGKEVVSGILGVSLTKRDKPWPCLEENERVNSTCLEWMNKARLYFRKLSNSKKESNVGSSSSLSSSAIHCYEIYWESLRDDFQLKDCFHLSENKGFYWYGGGEMSENQWPLNRTKIPFSPFVTGNKMELSLEHKNNLGILSSQESLGTEDVGEELESQKFQWGPILRRNFINSPGAAIQVTPDTPLHVSVNEKNDNMLCIGGNRQGYPVNDRESPVFLNYSICTGDNIRDLTSYVADKDIWDGLKHEDVQLTNSLTQAPIWRILPEMLNHGNLSESSLLNHTDRISALHFSEGFILIDETWQREIGDLSVDPDRFATISRTFNITRRRGFKVALTISPFFSTQSTNYVDGLQQSVWSWERGRREQVPALTKHKQWKSVALLDTTREKTRDWLVEKVQGIVTNYGIDALYLDLGTSHDLPQYSEFEIELKSVDHLSKYFIQALRRVKSVNTIGVSSAVHLPKLPTFVGMSPTESSWDGIQTLIPNILTLGLGGYPFIIPGPIGGDGFSRGGKKTVLGELPERNLYIRWLQLAHFFPVVQYSHLPSDYDNKVVEIATKMNVIRRTKLQLYFKKAITDSLTNGLPIIRPLWLLDPNDVNCLKVSDEFTIGGDILVAPIIRFNETYRDIYLPKGKWRDEMDGSSTKGEKWLHHHKVAEHQIAYFTKIGIGTE